MGRKAKELSKQKRFSSLKASTTFRQNLVQSSHCLDYHQKLPTTDHCNQVAQMANLDLLPLVSRAPQYPPKPLQAVQVDQAVQVQAQETS